jgi:hypothetical protein
MAVTLAAIGWGHWCAQPRQARASEPTRGDLPLFEAIVERVRAGENYYDAAGREMRDPNRDYPTASPFNWRTPLLHGWLLGKLPINWVHALLIAGAVATMLMAYGIVLGQGNRVMALASFVLLAGAFMSVLSGSCYLPGTDRLFFYTEMWSGMLIGLSVCAYGHDWWRMGVVTGLLALFFRELALPYCVLCVALAWRAQRRGEMLMWLGGLTLYGLYLAMHAREVAVRAADSDVAAGADWVQFGGMSFLLVTGQMNGFLATLPLWVTAVYLPLALLGLAGWLGPVGLRIGLAAGLYVAAFMVVGKPFNQYWGLVYAPLTIFGLVWCPLCLRDLALAAFQPEKTTDGNVET